MPRVGGALSHAVASIHPRNGTVKWSINMGFEGRTSTSDMAKDSSDRIELLQGTLDMLILRTVVRTAHAHHFRRNKIRRLRPGWRWISQAAKNRFAKSGQMVSAAARGPDGLASIFNKNGT